MVGAHRFQGTKGGGVKYKDCRRQGFKSGRRAYQVPDYQIPDVLGMPGM